MAFLLLLGLSVDTSLAAPAAISAGASVDGGGVARFAQADLHACIVETFCLVRTGTGQIATGGGSPSIVVELLDA